MARVAVIVGLILVAVVLLIATGRSDGRDGNLIEIYHLNLEDIELTMADYVNPPAALVDQYPAVVAEVNGDPVAGRELVTRQILLELNRRDAIGSSIEAFREQQLAAIDATDPLESIVDEKLKAQAVERLGLLPSHEEAVAYTEEQEASVAALPPVQREASLQILRLRGLPTENWASNAQIVEGYRQGMGLAKLLHGVCPTYAAPQTPAPGLMFMSVGCTEFLDVERAHADIVYYVKWAD